MSVAPGSAPVNIEARPLSSSTVVVQWDEPLIPNGLIQVSVAAESNSVSSACSSSSSSSSITGGSTMTATNHDDQLGEIYPRMKRA